MREETAATISNRVPDDAEPQGATELIERRIRNMSAWLKENGPDCVTEQAHLDEGSRERVYWHYGYMVALKDVLKLLERTGRSLN